MGAIQEASEKIQHYVLDVIYERRKGTFVPVVRVLLRLLSAVFEWAVQVRLYCYRTGIFKTKSLGCMIVSIGNITVGGTGKTPAVEMFARALQKEGRKVAVISRGYRSSSRFRLKRSIKKLLFLLPREKQVKVVSDGTKIFLNSAFAGDEPYMLAKKLPGVVVIVDKDRIKAGEYAIQNFGVDTIILDDGYQYLSLNPRYDVVLVDTTNPFGNNRMLPGGVLREPISNLSRADLIMLTKSHPNNDLDELKSRIRQHNYRAEFIESQHRSLQLFNLCDDSAKDTDFIKGKRIALVSGIADPQGFEQAVQDFGPQIIAKHRFQDHHRFSEKEIRRILKEANKKNIAAIVTTEKDAVRFPKLENTKGIPIFYLQVKLEILSGNKVFQDCISRICFK